MLPLRREHFVYRYRRLEDTARYIENIFRSYYLGSNSDTRIFLYRRWSVTI